MIKTARNNNATVFFIIPPPCSHSTYQTIIILLDVSIVKTWQMEHPAEYVGKCSASDALGPIC
jgi:hypothetical protein